MFDAAHVHTIRDHFAGYVAGSVDWLFNYSGGAHYTTPNIGALLQLAIDRLAIDREGFSNGNYVGVIIRAKTPTVNNYVYLNGYSDSTTNCAKLIVYYR